MSRNYITIRNGETGEPLTVYREGSRTEIAPGQGAILSIPEGFCLSVVAEDGRPRGTQRNLLRIWQAAAIMAAAALLLNLTACTGSMIRRDAHAWSAYSKGVGTIVQKGNQREYPR